MAISVVMPALEMAQETGKLVSWMKKEGEPVKKGEMLLEVETDKAVVEIEAQGDGILGGVTAKVGDVVPVGQTIAWLLKPGEAVPAPTGATQTGRTGAAAGPAAAATAAPAAAPPASAAGAPFVTVTGTLPTVRETEAPTPNPEVKEMIAKAARAEAQTPVGARK